MPDLLNAANVSTNQDKVNTGLTRFHGIRLGPDAPLLTEKEAEKVRSKVLKANRPLNAVNISTNQDKVNTGGT